MLKTLFLELNESGKNSGYELTLEATHHGPYMHKPSVFVEVGSTELEWNDKENGKILANTIMNALKKEVSDQKIAIGIGGPHYCANFNKLLLRSNYAVSHICPKYHLSNLTEELVKEAIENTNEKVDRVMLDWKGLGTEKQRIIKILKNLGLEILRLDKV